MLRKLNLIVVSLLLTVSYGFSQSGLGSIRGTVTDGNSEEPIAFAKVKISLNGSVKGGATTDFDGKFQINSVDPGSYDVEVSSQEGHQPIKLTGVIVSSDQITFLDDLKMTVPSDVLEITEVQVIAYKVPLIDRDGGASGATITREDIARLPVRSAAGVAGTVGGVNSNEGSGAISVRGSRSDGTFFFIDGIKVRGSASLPKSAIEEVKVITGGLPANYGDATGGIISVTTRGPSAKYFGSAEVVTSGFYFAGSDPLGNNPKTEDYTGRVFGFDKYAYNLFEGMLSGPLWMQKDSLGNKTKPRLGFLVSANITDQLDSRPLAGGSWRIKKQVKDDLLANPLRPTSTGFGTFHNSQFLRQDSFEKTDWRMNARNTSISAQGKVDVNTGPSVNLTFGGSMNYSRGNNYSYAGSLLNFGNFGYFESLDWRVFGRLTQRFNNNDPESSSKIKSAYYSLMVDFSKVRRDNYDPNHGYNLFNYGHVGRFTTTRRRSHSLNPNTNNYEHDGFRDILVDFEPSETNSALAAITSQYYSIYEGLPEGRYENLLQIQQGSGLLNGDSPRNIYNIWSNIGAPFNGFGVFENDQFRVTGSGSANIGDHSISVGFEFERRWDRGWTNGTTTGGGGQGPVGLWQIARQLTNFHITELDLNQATLVDSLGRVYVNYERLNTGYAYLNNSDEYGGQVNNDNQSFFDYNLRQYLFEQGLISEGVRGTDFIDVDKYDPNIYSLDMFSPDELLNQGNSFVSYYGFDHTGEKVRGITDIDKYFTDFDENGNFRRFVGAFQPIYMAGYIMDKFAFRDIVFNVGVRVDIFDANQPVLKDRYLFYEARTAAEARATGETWVNIPGSVGDDYVVYVNDVNNPTQINGFRDGDIWYDANGVVVEDPQTLRGPGGIAPWLLDPSLDTPTADAFEDYTPQVNVMPRIAFSFPISDEASFFAHYDILTKRPTSGFRFDPFEYQFINDRSATIANSALRPERTIDYEVGFQQVLTRTSSLKISAFYREQRDNVQLQNIFEAYPATYSTFSNRDFGTVKGMTIAYDLRRTGNIRMTANYTLQFADGTGSDATSAAGLIQAGLPNLRAIFPYSFDRRHAFNVTFDYRYGTGRDYNGPLIGDFEVLGNTGLNIVSNIYSGNPYSAQGTITNAAQFNAQNSGLDGTTNGSRLPWAYRLDLQLDRTFELEMGKEDNRKAVFLNVYFRVTNLFNQFNVLSVYRATGNWDDDGFLAAAASQTSIQNQLDEQAFRDYYLMKVQNPFNISAPRTIRLGIKFDF